MDIIITGATGFIGSQLVPILKNMGHRLLLVGRDAQALDISFPEDEVCTYDDLSQAGAGYDMLLHLAVANNNSPLLEADIFDVNVSLLQKVALDAQNAGVSRIVSVSSVHALDPDNMSAYARSKRAGEDALNQLPGLNATTIYLPAVYGDRWAGKLSLLNRLPRPLANMVFAALAALAPICHIARLAEFIDAMPRSETPTVPIILAEDQDRNMFYTACRTLIDWSFAFVILIFFFWLLALVWIWIKLDSKGSGIFAQTRIGRHGKPFTCYKFRTMAVGTQQTGTHDVSPMAITKVGSFLRKTKIDELPQVLNILRGELSLIGPRPCLPVQKDLIEQRRMRGVLELKPGITGLSQIQNIDMSNPVLLAKSDARYTQMRGLILDIKIIVATMFGRGQGDKIAEG